MFLFFLKLYAQHGASAHDPKSQPGAPTCNCFLKEVYVQTSVLTVHSQASHATASSSVIGRILPTQCIIKITCGHCYNSIITQSYYNNINNFTVAVIRWAQKPKSVSHLHCPVSVIRHTGQRHPPWAALSPPLAHSPQGLLFQTPSLRARPLQCLPPTGNKKPWAVRSISTSTARTPLPDAHRLDLSPNVSSVNPVLHLKQILLPSFSYFLMPPIFTAPTTT